MMRRTRHLIPLFSLICFIIVWELVVDFGLITRNLASPSQIAQKFYYKLYNKKPDGATLVDHIIASLQVFGIGTSLGFVLGFILGSVIGWSRLAYSLFKVPFEIIRNISPIAYIPITIVWFGIGTIARSMIIFVIVFIITFYIFLDGMKTVPRPLINVAKVFGAGNWTIFRYIALPACRSYFLAALRQAIVSGWQTVVAAELLAAQVGLGYLIIMGRQFVQISLTMVGMLTIGAIGFILTLLTNILEKRILRGWQ